MMDYKKPFAHDHEPIKDLLTAIKVAALYFLSHHAFLLIFNGEIAEDCQGQSKILSYSGQHDLSSPLLIVFF